MNLQDDIYGSLKTLFLINSCVMWMMNFFNIIEGKEIISKLL